MRSRGARLTLLILFIVSLGATVYLFWNGESLASARSTALRSFEQSARSTTRAVLDTRADVGQNPSPATSAALAAQFPAYQASLGLRDTRWSRLTADTMLDAIRREVIRSAETYLRAAPANTIPALGEDFVITGGGPPGTPPTTRTFVNDWIDVDNAADRVRSVDMKHYLDFVATQATLKPAPASLPPRHAGGMSVQAA